MAKIISAIGMSHSPMMATEGKYWMDFADNDYDHRLLFDEAGNHVTYDELNKKRGNIYEEEALPEKMIALYQEMEKGYAHLKDTVAKVKPDVVVVISNDHPGEFLDHYNVPALAVFCGKEIISIDDEKRKARYKDWFKKLSANPEAYHQMTSNMGVNKNNVWPGSSQVAFQIIESFIEQGIDIGVLKEAEDPNRNGHGLGYGMVVTQLMDNEKLIPMIPIYLNAVPPNVLTPTRCYDVGRALRSAIEAIPEDLNVCVIASGGLSHFVTNVDLDKQILDALHNKDEVTLRNLPRHLLQAGNAEILNWITLAGAVEHLDLKWKLYLPVFRTPAGTGIGMTFAEWL